MPMDLRVENRTPTELADHDMERSVIVDTVTS
jgi:hypothetical protein